MGNDSHTQNENDSVGAYNFFVCFDTNGNIIPRQKKQIEKLLSSGVPKGTITIYIGPEDCEIPYSVDDWLTSHCLPYDNIKVVVTR